jgi:glycosyltransferase involved in cell wall biosynthesis
MKIILFANTDWYLYNFRLPLAKFLKEKGIEIVLISPHGDYVSRLKEAGFRHISLPMERRSLNPWQEAKLLTHLTKLYTKEKPDLVHHFTIKSVIYGSLAAQLAGIQARVNAVTGLGHVFTSKSWQARLLRPLVKSLFRIALRGQQSRLIVQNPDDYQSFLETRLAPLNSLRLIRGSGVDTERFQPSHPSPAEVENRQVLRVLLATRLLWEKGIGEYVEAARLLKPRYPFIEFLLAGSPDSGNPASVPPEQIMAWEREGMITALGQVENMENLLRQVDLAVLPSYREGTPRSLLEAAACGLPIVTTDVPGCREIVQPGVNGLLVPCRNAQKLAVAIQEMVENPEARTRMGKASRAKVLAEFDQRIVLEKTYEVYREVLPSLAEN